MSWGLAIASGLTFFTCLIHIFGGGPDTARPLLASELEPVAKYTNYYCWHMATITILAMALAFLYAAFYPSGWDVGFMAWGLSLGFTAWSLLLIAWKHPRPFQLPQWTLFLVICLAGAWGLWG